MEWNVSRQLLQPWKKAFLSLAGIGFEGNVFPQMRVDFMSDRVKNHRLIKVNVGFR